MKECNVDLFYYKIQCTNPLCGYIRLPMYRLREDRPKLWIKDGKVIVGPTTEPLWQTWARMREQGK